MFTGLIQDRGAVVAVTPIGTGARLTIKTKLAADLAPGDSIAVNGVCLTAINPTPEQFEAEAIPETLDRSTTGALAAGDHVNLELAMRMSDRLGGHIVQGHVDGVATVSAVRDEDLGRRVSLDLPDELLEHVVEKGSITFDGVSLTVASIAGHTVDVALIPETLERTSFGQAVPGTKVNVEADVLAKQVARLVDARLARTGASQQ